MGLALDDDDSGRWQPTPVAVADSFQEIVDREDRLRAAADLKRFPGGRTKIVDSALKPGAAPLSRDDMLGFTRGKDWKAVLKDPAAAAAMERVRSRVDALHAEGRAAIKVGAPVPPEAAVGTRLLNAQQGPKPNFFRTSTINPLDASGMERGWDPRVRLWTGRQMDSGEPEQTTFWCQSWGASASDKGLDTNFLHVRPGDRPAFNKEMHSKGWR